VAPTVTVTLTALVLVTEADSNSNCESRHSFHACTWKMEMGSSRNLNNVIPFIPFEFTPVKTFNLIKVTFFHKISGMAENNK